MEKFILDTNIFFNLEADLGLGKKTKEVVLEMTRFTSLLKKQGKAAFYMTPGILEEFMGFFNDKKDEYIKNFLATVTIKSPDQTKISFSSSVFYRLVSDIRERSYRGLNISEEEIEKAGRLMMDQKEMNKKDFQIKIGSIIKKFRERYRNATRTGFLDSVNDLDIIVLSKEQNGYLVTTDEGVIFWGRIFGVKEMPVNLFLKRLQELLDLPPQE